jgi:CBS domain containing-hemolysin-like protein
LGRILQKLQTVLGGRTEMSGNLESVIETALDGEADNGRVFTPNERRMLANVLTFGKHRVEDVMVPRADINGIEIATPLDETLRVFAEASHSRLPLYRDALDDPVGMVHIKDVMAFIAKRGLEGALEAAGSPANGSGFSLARLRRDVLFVPPSMPVVTLLLKMQTTRVHMALVIDEFGGTDGLVSIEDLIEEIVGDIEDEHDVEEEAQLQPLPQGGFIADARLPVEDLEEALQIALVPEDLEEDIDTVGGLVFSLVGRVPQRGELICHDAGVEFEIVDADPRRIKRLKIHVAGKDAGAGRQAGGDD